MQMRSPRLFLVVTAALMMSNAPAQSTDPVPARWRLQHIDFPYIGFTTAYDCDALEDKVRNILVTLGAHPSTNVRASGCMPNRPSRTSYIDVATAVPQPTSEASEVPGPNNRAELLQRMDLRNDFDGAQFTASRETFQLGANRKLALEPGDCELMAELRDHVLPKLGIEIIADDVACTPNQLDINTPRLSVAALVPEGTSG